MGSLNLRVQRLQKRVHLLALQVIDAAGAAASAAAETSAELSRR